MIVVIYQGLIISIFAMLHGKHAFSVDIEGSEAGLLGENGTTIECLYTREQISQVFSVSFMAFNRSSTSFHQIATYIPDQIPKFPPTGQYLNGRVTLTTITQSSMKAVMTFNKLMCIDETFYKCKVNYVDFSSNILNEISSNINISVQVPPSKPDSISIVNIQADYFLTTANYMEDRTSPPSNTSKEIETFSDLQIVTPNDTTSFNNSSLTKTDHDSTSSTPSNADFSSNSSYRTTTFSTQQTTTAQGIAKGDNITVVCTGDVGKPPAKHVFQKYRSGNILSMTYTATETKISEIAENCSYYRTSSFTFQVTAKDNNASIRCVVNSSMPEFDKLYKETTPIEVNSDTSTLPSSSTGSSSGTDEKSGNPTKDLTPVYIGVFATVVVILLVVLGCYLFKRKRKGKDESAKNSGSTNSLMHCNSKYVGESRPGAYDSVALEGNAPVISSGKKEQNAEDVRKHNEEYMKKQKNEEKIENKSPTSHQPVIYAAVNEAKKSKYKQTIETQDSSNQQKDDTYAGTQEGVYDQSGDRRHKVNENAEQFDTVGDIKKRNSTDGIESSIQSSQKGSYVNQAFNKGEKRQVATVPPISRSSGGSQGDEQTSEINAKRSQKRDENVKGTDNTHTSDAHTINQTSL